MALAPLTSGITSSRLPAVAPMRSLICNGRRSALQGQRINGKRRAALAWRELSSARSRSFVEIRNSPGLIGQTNQGNSTHDRRPTNYNSTIYDRQTYNSSCAEEGRYPDTNANDRQPCPD